MNPLVTQIMSLLEEKKAEQVISLHVYHLTTMTDDMIIATGNSGTQLKAFANHVHEEAKKLQIPILGMEGAKDAKSPEWILIDLGNIIVHVMLPHIRAFYNLERLWNADRRELPEEAAYLLE